MVATAVGTSMSIGAVITGVFGMNLHTPLIERSDPWLFNAIVVLIVSIAIGESEPSRSPSPPTLILALALIPHPESLTLALSP